MATEELSTLRVSLGLDSAQFTQSMAEINRKIRAVKSEFVAASDGTKDYARSLDGLEAKGKNLTRLISLQQSSLQELGRRYEDAKNRTGENSKETEKLATQYNRAQGQMNRLQRQLKDTNESITDQTSSWKLVSQSVDNAVKSSKQDLDILESSYRQIRSATADFGSSIGDLETKSKFLNDKMEIQRKTADQLRLKYNELVRAKGEDNEETKQALVAYNNAKAGMNDLNREIGESNRELAEHRSTWKQVSDTVDNAVKGNKRDLAVLESAYKEAKSGVNDFGSELSDLDAKSRFTNEKLRLQQNSVENLRNKYEELKRARGADADETKQALVAYNNASAEMKETRADANRLSDELREQSTVWGKLARKAKQSSQDLQETGNNISGVASSAFQGLATATVAVGGGLGIATKQAADFEAQISSVKSVMSPEDVKKFGSSLSDLAIEMGAKTKYSALEAAQGIEELVKAGVSAEDIMSGGLEGALSLATAGELELADAAEIASVALNAFKDDNLTVAQAADILAGAANASATDVSELKFGLSSVSAVASGVGLSFKETTDTLALFAQNGLKGSDAGTSLKTMLLNLSPTTKAQTEAFSALGLSQYNTSAGYKFLIDNGIKPMGRHQDDIRKGLEQLVKEELGAKATKGELAKAYEKVEKASGFASSAFYDEEGQLKSMTEISGLLQNAMKGLNKEQQQTYLRTMFGTDAIRAGNIIVKEGADGYDKMSESISKIKAADVAKEKLNNLNGVIEQLKGSLSTAAITVGTALIPAIRGMVEWVQKGIDWFNGLDKSTQETFAKVGAGVAIFLAVATAISAVVAAAGFVISGFGAVVGVVGPMLTAMAGVASGAGIAATAVGLVSSAAGILGTAFTVLTGPIGIAVGLIAGIGYAMVKFDKEMDKPILKSKMFSDEISKSTKKAVGSFIDLEQDVSLKLNTLAATQGKITEKMANDIVSKYKAMGEKILTAMEDNHRKQKEKTQELFASNSALSEKEENKILAKMEKDNDKKKNEVEKYQKQRIKIIKTAADQNRALTDEERQDIARIETKMREHAVKELSKNQKEQKSILATLRDQASEMTAEQAGKMVKNSIKARDGSVKEARGNYKDQVKQIQYMRDETKTITADQAKKMIAKAEETRDNSVRKAQSMHKSVVKAAKSQAKEHKDEIDWETGKVKTGWQNMTDGVAKAVNWFKGLFSGKGTKKAPNIKSTKAYANGTPGGTHPGGVALVGEEGPELAHIPGQGTTMLGQGGQHLVDLPKGSSVLPARHTQQVMKQYGIPMYASGIGNYFDFLTSGPKAIFNKVKDKFNLGDGLIPGWMNSITGSPMEYIKPILTGGFKSLTDKMLPSLFGDNGSASSNGSPYNGNMGKKNVFSGLIMTQRYGAANGSNGYSHHDGNDYAGPIGTPLRAAMSGMVSFAGPAFQGYNGGFGNLVKIRNGPYEAFYGHLSRVVAQAGDIVKAGSSIVGLLGSSGNSTGPHVHFEVRKNGVPIDPNGFLGGYATGGVIRKEQAAMIGEGNKEEVVIPLEQFGNRAKQLWQYAGEKLGMFDAPSRGQLTPSKNNQAVGGSGSYTVSNKYEINITAEINNDQDINELAFKIEKAIDARQKASARANGVF